MNTLAQWSVAFALRFVAFATASLLLAHCKPSVAVHRTDSAAPTQRHAVVAPTIAPTVLWFGGDTHFGDSHSPLFSQTNIALSDAIGVVNLEGTVRPQATDISEQHLRSSAHTLQTLRAAGVRVVSVANNHRLDDGPEGFAQTVSLTRNAGLLAAGADTAPVVLPTPNGRVAIVAIDISGNSLIDRSALAAQVRTAQGQSEWTVVSFHTSGPALYRASERLRDAAAAVLDAGASIVVAHGTHTVAPVERRGPAVIAWGLGNLLFNCDCSVETEGMILRVELSAGQPIRAAVLPLQAGIHGASAQIGGPEGSSFALFSAMGVSGLSVDGGLGTF